MTYYGAKELAASFRTVRGNTIKIAEEIPEEQYGFRVTPETRSVAEMLAHLALLPRMQKQIHFDQKLHTFVGYDFFPNMAKHTAEQKKPRSKAEILELLRTEGESFAQALEGASEAVLSERVEYPEGMMPPSKSRFEMLIGVKEHEMHHRAQLMVMERLLGITPHLTRQMQERIAAVEAAKAAH
ncbi:MAG TPA: DinB family protein [Bryobacteraceae bacterium]|nr:DinB family protein [Bryobacteraceae bacterium]